MPQRKEQVEKQIQCKYTKRIQNGCLSPARKNAVLKTAFFQRSNKPTKHIFVFYRVRNDAPSVTMMPLPNRAASDWKYINALLI